MDIEFLRTICKKFPSVTEDIKWENHLCFLIAGKMFCITNLEPPFAVSFKTTEEDFGELIQSPFVIPAPYMARNKWVQVQNPERFSVKEWEEQLWQSYSLIKSKLPKIILNSL